MPPISMPGANRAELNVQIGKTSLEDLAKFEAKAGAKGNGEIRARQNKDGSVTLYMPAADKIRLRSVFGESWGGAARSEKRDLAAATIKDIVRSHLATSLPDKTSGSGAALNTRAETLLARLDEPLWNHDLAAAVRDTTALNHDATAVTTAAQQATRQAAYDESIASSPAITDHFQRIDVILSEPTLAPKLGAFMAKQFTTENFTFLTGLQGYDKVAEPAEKMLLAEALFKMVESPENPPMSKGSIGKLGDTHKQLQINISSDTAKLIIKDIQHLRMQAAAGGITSPADKAMLDNLFQKAGREIAALSNADLKNFINTPAFQTGVGEILIARPVYAAVPEFKSLEKVLADPQIRDAFQTHLASNEGPLKDKSAVLAAGFDRFNQMESLAAMPAASASAQADLLAQIDLLLNGSAPPAAPVTAPADPDAAEVLSLDSDAASTPANRDPVTESFSRRLDIIKQMAQGSAISLPTEQGGIPHSLAIAQETRVEAGLRSLLNDMLGDAANQFRGDALKSFIGSPPMLAVLAERHPQTDTTSQLDWQPGAEKHYGSFEPFAGGPTAKVGGQSGSVQTEVSGQKYQLKFDIANNSWMRQAKAGYLNTENDSEMIAANILRGMRSDTTRALLPQVDLQQDSANNQTVVTSKYLQGGKGNLDQYYEANVGPLPSKLIGNSHVKVAVNSSGPSGDGVLRLSGQASQDALNNLVDRALVADHDVNVGNGMAVKGELNAIEGLRIGQIDFGHAFNDLINGFGGRATGGGVRFENNRILDFFNRETVSGNPFKPGAQDSKLWRDYIGVGPSAGMTQALRSRGTNPNALDGLVQAKTAYIDLIADLEAENTPEATGQMTKQLASLAKISANVGHPIDLANTAPGDVVREAFQGLTNFITAGQEQMLDVADLSALQTRIEAFVSDPANASAPIPADIRAEFAKIVGNEAHSLRTADGTGLNWMKLEKAVPGFVGTLDSYVEGRRELAGNMPVGAAAPSGHLAQLMAAAQKGSVTAPQLQGLQALADIHPAAADRLAEAVLAHLANPSQPMPDVDAGIVRGGIAASADAGLRHGESGLQIAGAARKTALSLNIARLVTNPDGSVNAGRLEAAITQLGQAPTPQTEHTRVAVKMLTRLRDDAGLAAQLQSIGAPRMADNPANGIVRATLGLPPGETVTAAHARQAALSALVSDLRQSSVGSCFGTATAIMVHDSMPEKFLAELKSLIEDGHFNKTLDGVDEQVAISQRVSTKELQQTITLDAEGLLATAAGKPVAQPTALHEIPGMRAGLAALGVAPDAMASTVSGAVKSMGKNAVLTPQAILQQIAMRQEGLSAEHLASVERIRTLDGQVRELSIAVERGGPDAAQAQREMSSVQRNLRQALNGIGGNFKTEAMDRLAESMGRATDAFQGQMDNRLLRAWEYTVSSVLEKGEGQRVKADALKVLTGGVESYGTDTTKMGVDTFARHTLFSSTRVVIERAKGRLDKTAEIFTVRPGLNLPTINGSLLTPEDRTQFNPNPATRPASDQLIFLHKFQTQMQSRFEQVMTARLAVQYDAAAMGSGEIAADGSSDRGGFVLFDTVGQTDPLTWRPIDTPQAYKALAASVMRDVGREVAASVARDQSAEVQQWLTQFSEKVGAHAETEAFTAVMVDRARFNTPARSETNPKPWEPTSGGRTHVTGKYLGSGDPKEVQLMGSISTAGNTPAHARGADFVAKVVDAFKGMGDALHTTLAEQGRDVGVPVRTTGHAFLARPGHPSLAGALASPDTAAWVTDKLVTPGQAQARKPMSVAEQRPVVRAVLDTLKVPANHPSRATILGALPDSRTPAQLYAWVKDQLETHHPAAFGDKIATADARAAAIEFAMVKNLKPAVPGIVLADTNWQMEGGRIDLGMVFNPISGGVEPWFSHEDGRLLGSNAKPEASTWASWRLMTNPAEFGYT